MADSAQKRAVEKYRGRLAERGMVRFEVMGCTTDRKLIRLFAKRLAEDGEDGARLREYVRQEISGTARRTGTILAALRRSPLVGEDIASARSFESGRDVDL